MVRALVPVSIFLALSGCTNLHATKWGVGDGSDADTDVDTDTGSTDTDSGTDTDSALPDDSGSAGDDGFDDPGDVVAYQDDNGVVNVDLTDASGDSNQDQEFYMVVVNTGSDSVGYRLRYYDASLAASGDTGAPSPPPASGAAATRTPPQKAPPLPMRPMAEPPPPPTVGDTDIGVTRSEFLVRSDLTDTDSYATVSATLWALGDNVEIWVDDDVPIDWDIDCDGVVDVPDQYDAYGFDNCDLSDIADIIDTNIIPNVESLYGQVSDINQDGRVSVVITPQLNAITLTSTDEDDYGRVLPSYAEPAVDLTDYNYLTNPGSDEQEVLYVFAPDPYGFFNPNVEPTVEAYTGYQLAAEVARSFTALVSYNMHYELNGGAVEEDWVNDVLGTFAAEYCGFGAAYHEEAWEYLDAPQRFSLANESTPGSLATLSRGAQYLFGLWLYQQAEETEAGSGPAAMASIVQTSSTGTDSFHGISGNFSDLVLRWQVALLTSGVTTPSGDPLVDTTVWQPYTPAETIVAPPDAPDGRFGANGYQSGLNINGMNHAYREGTTDTPEEIESRRVKMENTDAFIYTPGFEFSGWMEGNYSANAVRLTGINYDDALVQLQATGTGLVGAVVRWNDPTVADYSVENIFSATDANSVALPSLPSDGSQIHGVGQISAPGSVTSISSDGSETVDVPDTDRWLLDLTDRPSTETVPVIVWLDRHFADTDGSMGPSDPWIAVAPIELVPEPTVEGTQRGATCDGGDDFAYPTSLLAHLTSQLFLSDTMYSGTEDDDDPCGDQSDTATTCADDWDRDGVLDADEPTPDTFFGQTRVMECTLNGNVPPATWEYNTGWLDQDELDDDDLPTVNYAEDAGGRSGITGEEGYVSLDLEGGREYLIVVGANSNGTGTYELSVRQTE